jgi:hypothetical protein
MEWDKWRHTSARVQQDFTSLQRVETERLKANADLKRTLAHKLEPSNCESTSGCSELRRGRMLNTVFERHLSRRETAIAGAIEIGTRCENIR